MAKGPIGIVGSIFGWIVVAALVFAIMVIWDWDPVAFIVNSVERISEFFLSWDWFRKLVGG